MDIITTYQHLKGVEIDETNVEPELMIHVILRASEYAKIKPNLALRVGIQENQYKNSHQLAGPQCPLELRQT